jgi:hypothetical protein
VQTQSLEHISQVALNSQHNSQRNLLGALEATQSSVVDVENIDSLPYEVTHVQSVPTLTLLDSVNFDNVTEEWSFTYETMSLNADNNGQINQYYRILYFTHPSHNIVTSDTGNNCLLPGTDYNSCLEHLRSDYVVLLDNPNISDSLPRDRIETTTWASSQVPGACELCALNATVVNKDGSATQTLHLRIPHRIIRNFLARHRNTTSSDIYSFTEIGAQVALDFGVGMMFLPLPETNTNLIPTNNILVFDMFTILENTFQQLAITKRTAYSVATHVAFWTTVTYDNPLLRVVTIEYLLDSGHLLKDIKMSVNNGSMTAGGTMLPITVDDCVAMQELINAMPSSLCLARQQLCTPVSVVDTTESIPQTFVTVVFPIPTWHTGHTFQFNSLLFSNLTTADNGRGMISLSSLNFFSSHAPSVTCTPSEIVSFDATKHVRIELYRGHTLVAESISGTFSVFNDTSLSLVEALVTIVLRPDDTAEALTYFEKYSDERLRLDEVYMSHSKISNILPSEITNTLQGSGSGRTSLALSQELLQNCPLLSSTQQLESIGFCTTTKDWDQQGRHVRIGSHVYYVHQVLGTPETEADDLAWLANNVFGPSDMQSIRAFRTQVLTQPFDNPLSSQRKPYASIYWIHPIFLWPNAGPIGLVDKTVISMAWSIAP